MYNKIKALGEKVPQSNYYIDKYSGIMWEKKCISFI